MAIRLNVEYSADDFNRFDNSASGKRAKTPFMNEGPGVYLCRVTSYRVGQVEKEGRNYGKDYQGIELEIEDVLDPDSHFKAGDRAAIVTLMSSRTMGKFMLAYAAAMVGLPAVIPVPDGKFAGEPLPLVSADTVNGFADHDFDAEPVRVQVRVYAIDRDGKTYLNIDMRPESGVWPSVDDLRAAGVDIDALVIETFGRK